LLDSILEEKVNRPPITPDHSPDMKTLERNLDALAISNTGLVERICFPVYDSHIRQSADGHTRYHYRGTWHRLSMTEEELGSISMEDLSANNIFLFGLGVGEHVFPLLNRFPSAVITAWDRDPWLVRLFLMQNDISDRISAGQLRFLMCADLIDLESNRPSAMVEHPFLRTIYRNEHRWLHHPIGRQRALLCEGELFVDDIAEVLWDQGYDVFTLDTTLLSLEEMTIVAHRIKPDFVMTVDYRNGLAEFCHKAGIELLSWEVNPTTDRLSPCACPTDRTHIFTYRALQVEEFQKAGFSQVEHLPLASNPARRKRVDLNARDRERYSSDVSFVGSSMVDAAEKHRAAFIEICSARRPGDPAFRQDICSRMETVLSEQGRNFSAYRIPVLFELHFSDLFDEYPIPSSAQDPIKLLSELAAARKRSEYVGALGSLGARVWGDEGWRPLEARGVHYMGKAGHFSELTKIYCGTRVNIDIGRLYQQDIIPMRIFDIISCGGFVLAEYSDELQGLFEIGNEIEAYHSLEELLEKASFYQKRPYIAESIAQKGMQKVHARHTIASRVRHILTSI